MSELERSAVDANVNSKKRLILLVVLPLFVVLVGLVIYLKGGRYVSTENAYVKADVIAISSQVSGAVVERAVTENETVKAGQLLFSIDDKAYKIAVAKAEANLAEVRTNLSSLKATYRERQSDLQVAQSNSEFAKHEQKRQANLATKHLVAEAAYDQVAHTSRVASQQIVGVQQDLKRIEETLAGAVDSSIEQHPSYLAAVAELQQAQLNLEHTKIYATQNGIVTRPPELGEFINVGAIAMKLVATDHLWIQANFVETDLTYVRAGQKVDVFIDTYPDVQWEGEVQSLSPATGAEFSVIPAQNATGNWVKIAQRVPVNISVKPKANAPQLQAGLSTQIEIDTGHKRKFLGLSI
jgi:membrane fusion protein, multidrug efflux system